MKANSRPMARQVCLGVSGYTLDCMSAYSSYHKRRYGHPIYLFPSTEFFSVPVSENSEQFIVLVFIRTSQVFNSSMIGNGSQFKRFATRRPPTVRPHEVFPRLLELAFAV